MCILVLIFVTQVIPKIGSINSYTGSGRVFPTVLGIKPVPLKGHSALLLKNGQLLIVKMDSTLDGCIWFLEVRMWFSVFLVALMLYTIIQHLFFSEFL